MPFRERTVLNPPDSPAPLQPAPPSSPAEWSRTAERLLESGAPLAAYDALVDALSRFPSDVRLRQLLALALARTGAGRSAIPILEALRGEGHDDEETLGMLARAHKDLWADGDTRAEQQRHLQLAYQYYRQAHRLSGGIWSGINAATMALLLEQRGEAQSLARATREQCLRAVEADPARAEDYWLQATLGEAALLLGDLPEAERAYARAAALGRLRVSDAASTRRNARLIIRHLGIDGAAVERHLRISGVVVFAGHLMDRPGRRPPRFPPALEEAARTAIRERLKARHAGFGYSSAACGGDILFLESLLELGGETHIVLPYNSEQFVNDSVDIVPGGDWGARYEGMLARARDVVTASEQPMSDGQLSYEYTVLLLEGMAGLRAAELDTELVPMVLWDGLPGDGPGGTASTVTRWRQAGRDVDVIDLAALLRQQPIVVETSDPVSSGAAASTAALPADLGPVFEPHIVTLLFADARGFSGLTEHQIPKFVQHFLGAVANALDRSRHQPVLRNTWGDGLFFVFSSVEGAGQFALDLSETVARADWTVWNLPADLSVRIGLHAGPAYACTDPVTGRPNYLGAHVSRAARIEPITPPGQVYASRAFAALAHAEQVTTFRCDYVGRTPLAKGFGTWPVYVVRRRRS
jgi:class 3 adenylate cyclase/tetratricopeptide (TPR) repeat protein